MAAIDLIVKWAINDLPDWQSDAVRRLLTQNEITEMDLDEILMLLKRCYSLNDIDSSLVLPVPLKMSDILGDCSKKIKITLKAISDITGVNALKEDSSIKFGHQGVSVIYGENGSGKSGYARILKKACNSRDTKERILPNVFCSENKGAPKAKFKISIDDGPDKEVFWEDEKEIEKENQNWLSNINFFDSKCASIIVDENNELSYLPYGAYVFEGLSSLLRILRERLEIEKPKPEKIIYPEIKLETKIGKFLNEINYKTPIETVEKLSEWTDKNEQQLTKLKKQLTELEFYDPKKQAQKIRNLKERINTIFINLCLIDNILSKEKIGETNQALIEFKNTQKALLIASSDSFICEPLSGVGINEWQILYNAAKEYSLKYAYPDKKFPNIEEGSLCVLCMQPLSEDAKKRMDSYRIFMEDRIKKDAENALRKLQKETKDLIELKIDDISLIKDVLDEIHERNEQLAENVKQYILSIRIPLNYYIDAVSKKEIINFLSLNKLEKDNIEVLLVQLEKEAIEKDKSANTDSLIEIKKIKEELESQKTLSIQKSNVIKYINELQSSKKYDKCISATNTITITSKGKSIVSQSLTPLLQSYLKEELLILNAARLPLNFKASGVLGETRHKIELEGCKIRNVNLSEILSEGEHRVVSIAGFFAELRTSENKCPIVFDDPVNSLDHRFREKIAERIVKESKDRQVIVFTHDIAFLSILKDKSAELQGKFYSQSVQKRIYPGECLDVPWHTMNVNERLNYLNAERDKIQSLYKTRMREYDREAGHIYALLRETWEVFVEEVLFYQTIKRYSGEIQTQRIKSVTVTTEDYITIDTGMSKCSMWMFGHDKSQNVDIHRPNPEELRRDIALLKEFSSLINKRREELRREREQALEPSIPEVG